MCLISVARRGTSRGSPPPASHPSPSSQQRESLDSGSSTGGRPAGSLHWIWGLLSLLGCYYYRCYFYFSKPKGERHIHTKLWDLFNMILANAFCLFFFLGEYLQVASLGVTRGCARSVAHWKLGMRRWAWGLRAGRRGKHRESAPSWEPGPGAPGSRTAREALEEGAVQRLAGCAEDREGDFQHSNHLRTHSRAARAHTPTHTLTCRP